MTTDRQRFGKHRLKVGIVEPERTSIVEERFGKHVLLTTDRMTTNSSRWWSLFDSPKLLKEGHGRTLS
jgi:hypothetical protein